MPNVTLATAAIIDVARERARSGLHALVNSHRPWERAIRNFEAEDHRSPPAPGSIVFTGSSSVRFWTTLERDMNPLPVVNRGFGGAHLAHVTHFAPRALLPLAPAAVVLYAGDNDLGSWTGKTAATVARDFVQFVELIRKELLETRIYALSIKPSRLRAPQWSEQRRANERIAEFAAKEPGVDYLDIATLPALMNWLGRRRTRVREPWPGHRRSPRTRMVALSWFLQGGHPAYDPEPHARLIRDYLSSHDDDEREHQRDERQHRENCRYQGRGTSIRHQEREERRAKKPHHDRRLCDPAGCRCGGDSSQSYQVANNTSRDHREC